MKKLFKKQNGKKKIEIQRDDYGINISFMRNGWQSTVIQVDEGMLEMLDCLIDEFQDSEALEGTI